jgi:hypothetical protein
MKLTIKIECDNAAFTPAQGTEVARILRQCAHVVDGSDLLPGEVPLFDGNGNRVGHVEVVED